MRVRPWIHRLERRQSWPGEQRGMTFFGMLFLVVLVGLVAYGVFRLIPAYLTYMKVTRALDAVAVEFKGSANDEGGIRRSLEKRWDIEGITTPSVKQVEFSKDGNGTTLHMAYDDVEPYISNVSLTVSFDKTVKIE
jgi:hypothetical protein